MESTAWIMLAITAAIYFIPLIVADARGKDNKLAIGMLNLLLGWTMIGWVAALVWACMNDSPAPD